MNICTLTLAAAASSPLHCCLLSTSPNPSSHSQIHRFFHCSSRSLTIGRCYSSLRESSNSLDLPLLPFQSDEVLVPSESKTLHLYEARFLALLEEIVLLGNLKKGFAILLFSLSLSLKLRLRMQRKIESMLKNPKIFVHFVLDPVLSEKASSEASFAARYACLVLIEKIERLEIGALVSIRGVGRVSIVDIIQMEPYLRGVVLPMQDGVSDNEREIQSKLEELRESLYNLQTLQIKLKASKDEQLQTQIKNSLTWAEREIHEDWVQSFVPKLAERLSFAALQPVSGFSHPEELSLQRKRLRAMEMRGTLERLQMGVKFVKQNIAFVAAKLAIQSLEM